MWCCCLLLFRRDIYGRVVEGGIKRNEDVAGRRTCTRIVLARKSCIKDEITSGDAIDEFDAAVHGHPKRVMTRKSL